MRARSGVRAITVSMPYTARFFRDGAIEVDCDWIAAATDSTGNAPAHNTLHRIEVPDASDSPWFRLPQSHLHIFTIGDTRAGVWIINSGVYVDDRVLQDSPGAQPQDKGGSVGYKWLVQPLPHRLGRRGNGSSSDDSDGGGVPSGAPPLQRQQPWRIEQGVLSSFVRVSQSANIPLQLDFDSIGPLESYIQIDKGTPMLQYIPATLPDVSLSEKEIDGGLVDYLVSLSLIHDGGDYRELGAKDEGASSIMKSHALSHKGDRRYQKQKPPRDL